MSREDRLIWERVWTEPLKTPILTADHVKYIKDVFINCLRDVFSRDPDFTYIRAEDGIFPQFDNENLGIVITDVYSYNVSFLPAITIRVSGSNLVPVSFNQNQKTYDYRRNPDGSLEMLWQEFSGLYDTSVTVNIHAWEPMTREELITRIALLFKHVLRDQLYADFGIFVKEVSVGGEVETPWSQDNNDMIFSQSISVQVLSGWNNRLPVGDKLEGINLQIVGDAVAPEPVPGEPPGGPCGGGGRWKVTPTQAELENSNRVDWVDEIRVCPELVLEDALFWNVTTEKYELTNDWYEVLVNNCGLNVLEVTDQINTGSWLREEILRAANIFRETADIRRNNKSSAFKTGTPGTGYTYKFSDGIVIRPNDTVVFPGNMTVTSNRIVYFPTSQITIDRLDRVIAPDNVDLDAWANPFTAITLERLEAFQFFLVLLDVVSPARQSIYDLNSKIDDFIAVHNETISWSAVTSIISTDGPALGSSTIVVTVENHGWRTGDYVKIEGADQELCNGLFKISVKDKDTFDYIAPGLVSNPIEGVITVGKPAIEEVRSQINERNEYKILIGKIVTFDRPPY